MRPPHDPYASPGQPASPHHSDVFSHLPVLLMRELRTAAVADLLDRLVASGWRPAQLRHRVGGEPSQGSLERDAAHLVEVLSALTAMPSPDAAHAELLRAREQARADAARQAPRPASEAARAKHLAAIRGELRGLPRPPREPELRTRPACSLCGGEGSFFVTHEVHLCNQCVAVLATGEATLRQVG